MAREKKYFKLLALQVDHYESSVKEEFNFPNTVSGRKELEEKKTKLESEGLICFTIKMPTPQLSQ